MLKAYYELQINVFDEEWGAPMSVESTIYREYPTDEHIRKALEEVPKGSFAEVNKYYILDESSE